jgi:hypothetical protein
MNPKKKYRFPFRTLFVTKPLLFESSYREFIQDDNKLLIQELKQNEAYVDFGRLHFFSPALLMCQYLKKDALRTAVLSLCDEGSYEAVIKPTLCQYSIKSYIESNDDLYPLLIKKGETKHTIELNISSRTNQKNRQLMLADKEYERIHAVIFDGTSLQYKHMLYDMLFQSKQHTKPSMVVIDKTCWIIDKSFCRDFLIAGHDLIAMPLDAAYQIVESEDMTDIFHFFKNYVKRLLLFDKHNNIHVSNSGGWSMVKYRGSLDHSILHAFCDIFLNWTTSQRRTFQIESGQWANHRFT